MSIEIKRVYEPKQPEDGYRVLIDRLWPRGLKKEDAAVDLWFKEIAPSPELRKWFGHKPELFEGFESRYRAEVEGSEALQRFNEIRNANGVVTLLYAAKDPVVNHARVLKRILEEG